jgi:hypothetical protein
MLNPDFIVTSLTPEWPGDAGSIEAKGDARTARFNPRQTANGASAERSAALLAG